jgi:hypothetical protein
MEDKMKEYIVHMSFPVNHEDLSKLTEKERDEFLADTLQIEAVYVESVLEYNDKIPTLIEPREE